MHQNAIKKYKGTTLVEVMIAMALTSFAATLAVVIFLNIQKSTIPFFKIKAMELAEKYMDKTISEKKFFDKTEQEEGFIIKKKIMKDPVFYDCCEITIGVFDNDKKKIAELQATVYAE